MANEIEEKCFLKEKRIGRIPTTLPALYDTDISNVEDGQVLKYDSEKQKWVNGTGGGGGPTPTVGDGTITFYQGGSVKGSFTTNQSTNAAIYLDTGGPGTGPVTSVNTKTGDVVLTASDVGAMPSNTTIGNGTITIKQGNNVKGSFSVNQTSNTTINLSDGGGGGGDVGTLDTTWNTAGLEPSSSESFENNIQLHKVSKTGNYQHLNGREVVIEKATSSSGLLRPDGSIDYTIKATETALQNEINRASQAEGHLDVIKADKVANATANNLAALDSTGNLIDSGLSRLDIAELYTRLNEALAELTGIDITVTPREVTVNDPNASVAISVSLTDSANDITLKRGNDTLTTDTGTSLTFTDTFGVNGPSPVGIITYTVSATINGVPRQRTAQVEVKKQSTSLSWSESSMNYYMGGTVTEPTLSKSSNITGLDTINYSSSKPEIVSVDNTGQLTLNAVGGAVITATFAGDTNRLGCSASYIVTVVNNVLNYVRWNDASISPSALDVYDTTPVTINKGTVMAFFASGQVNVTNDSNTEFFASSGTLTEGSNNTLIYTPPTTAGTYTIGVRYHYGASTMDATDPYTQEAKVLTFVVAKKNATLTWSQNSCTAYLSGGNTFPTLSTDSHMTGAITYSSSKSSVATINSSTGEITLQGAGNNCIITASYSEDSNFHSATASYTLTVVNDTPTPTTDYYVGWTNGTESDFANQSDSSVINGAVGYSSSSNPTYTRAFGNNNIFYLLYQANNVPTITFISMGQRMTQNIIDDNTCPHSDVVIDGVTYKEFGIWLSAWSDPTDSIEISF